MPIDPNLPAASTAEGRQAERLAQLERRLRALEGTLSSGTAGQIPVVATLPTAGRQGRIVMLQSTGAVYKDTGSSWVLV